VDPDRFGPLARRVVHLVRNAVAHGVEAPEDRARAGKPEAGTVAVAVDCADGWLGVRVSDDGAGIDALAVRKRAEALGLAGARELATTDDGRVLRLILAQGVSTSGRADEASGRGVGLSAVLEEVERLGGEMDIESSPGRGTTFVVRVPLAATEKGKEQA
jgi:two-component system chemotaxis sensor kinase CheA